MGVVSSEELSLLITTLWDMAPLARDGLAVSPGGSHKGLWAKVEAPFQEIPVSGSEGMCKDGAHQPSLSENSRIAP